MIFKKFLSLTLSVILFVTLLSACKKPNSPTIENVSSKPEEEVSFTLSETIEKTAVDGLYKLGTEIKADSSKVDIKVTDNIAHIFFDMGETTQVVSFSVCENLVLGSSVITGNNLNFGALDAGGYYAINLDSATLFIYGKDGTVKKEVKICDGSLVFGALDMSGQFVVYQKTDSSRINRYDLLANETKESAEDFSVVGVPSSDKDSVYIKDQSGKHYNISFKDFTFKKTKTEAFREYVDCVGVAVEGDFFTQTILSDGIVKYMAKRLGEGEVVIAAQEKRFITVPSKNRQYFRFYNMDSSMVTKEIDVQGAVLDAQFVGEEYIFVAIDDRNTAENAYRLFSINDNQNREPFESSRLDEAEIYKNVFGKKDTDAAKQAEKFEEEYNIRFLYGKVGDDFKVDFNYQNADGIDVIPKFKVAEKVLKVLPAELLMEATAGREIWIYFCTQLDNKGTEYLKLAAHTELYNHRLILIDAKCSEDRFAELLCHEFAHILDDYIPQSFKNGFSEITPEDIKNAAYTNNYTKISTDQYTPYDKDKSNVWFYNNYCRINEKEDRTITLGEMFKIYAVPSTGDLFVYENVKKKAGYLSKALEETFDYCKKTDKQFWELAFPYSE